MAINLDYFEEYRRKLKLLNELRLDYSKLRDAAIAADQKVTVLNSELENIRKIITIMVENDYDEVEAKLKIDELGLVNSIWQGSTSIYDLLTATTNPYPVGGITTATAMQNATITSPGNISSHGIITPPTTGKSTKTFI